MSIQIEKIAKEVDLWRSQKKSPQEHMPKILRNKILSLQGYQENREIIVFLKLNNNFFDKRKSNKKPSVLTPSSLKGRFVKLPVLPIIKKTKLIINLPNGVTMEFFE